MGKSLAENKPRSNITPKKPTKKSSPNSNKSIKNKDNLILTPIPGVVVELLVAEGEKVKVGDTLLSLEAMKMENRIYAPHDGTVSKVLVNEGEEVMDGQPLIEFLPGDK